MADWFEQNAPRPAAGGGDWFSANAPSAPPAPSPEVQRIAAAPSVLDAPRTPGQSVKKFLGGAWSTANPVTAVAGLASAVASPIETAGAIVDKHAEVAGRASESFRSGDYLQGLRHGINAIIPLLGPALDDSQEKVRGGEVAEGLGEIAGLAVAPKVLQGTARAAGAAAQGVKAAAGVAQRVAQNPAARDAALTVASPRMAAARDLARMVQDEMRPPAPVEPPPLPPRAMAPMQASEPPPIPVSPMSTTVPARNVPAASAPVEPPPVPIDRSAGLDPAIREAMRAKRAALDAREAGRPVAEPPVAAPPATASEKIKAAAKRAKGPSIDELTAKAREVLAGRDEITRTDLMAATGANEVQAARVLTKLSDEGVVAASGKRGQRTVYRVAKPEPAPKPSGVEPGFDERLRRVVEQSRRIGSEPELPVLAPEQDLTALLQQSIEAVKARKGGAAATVKENATVAPVAEAVPEAPPVTAVPESAPAPAAKLKEARASVVAKRKAKFTAAAQPAPDPLGVRPLGREAEAVADMPRVDAPKPAAEMPKAPGKGKRGRGADEYGYATALVSKGWQPENLARYRQKQLANGVTEGELMMIEGDPQAFIKGGWKELRKSWDRRWAQEKARQKREQAATSPLGREAEAVADMPKVDAPKPAGERWSLVNSGTKKESKLTADRLSKLGYQVEGMSGSQGGISEMGGKRASSYRFETNAPEDVQAVLAAFEGKSFKPDFEWLSRQYPEAYRKVSALFKAATSGEKR